MLDSTHLRTTVTSGRYVVDPFAVADALLARAGIAIPAAEPRERQAPADDVSPDGARSRTDPEPPRLHE
jgi:hypothetical protein